MRGYQEDYAAGRPQMYDKDSRIRKAERVVKLFEIYLGKKALGSMKVLDIGSSTGIIDNVLAKSFGQVVGIDIDKDAVKFASKNFKRKNLTFKVDDSMKLSFKDNTFDAVICMQVYEHVPNSARLFKEIHRVLKPGGLCYLSAINRLWPWEPHHNLYFLSWLPKPLANFYLKLTSKGSVYYENLLTYWGLRRLASRFEIIEYTSKIVRYPGKFLYGKLPRLLGLIISIPAKYLAPSFIWLLKKEK